MIDRTLNWAYANDNTPVGLPDCLTELLTAYLFERSSYFMTIVWLWLTVTDYDWLWLTVSDCDWLVSDYDWLWLTVTDYDWMCWL